MKTVAVIVGSLRRDSITLKLTHAIERAAKGTLAFDYVDLAALPMYNEDLWASPPDGVLALKRTVEAADAVLFVTPEYNRSVPPVVKNAIDWGSRPWGKNSWNAKPGAMVGISPGQIGGAVALSHLRGSLLCLDVVIMGQPEAYVSFKPDMVDADGAFAQPNRDFWATYVQKFDTWIARTALPKADTQPNG